MWLQGGPALFAAASFGIGVVASLLPSIHDGVARSVALSARGAESRGARAADLAAFQAGLLALCVPLGAVAGLTGALTFYPVWSMAGSVALVLVCAVAAASMFGAFELRLAKELTARLVAVGGPGLRGSAARGVAAGLLGAPAALPFALGICTAIVRVHSPVAVGLASMSAFALGLGASTALSGLTSVRLPVTGAWTRAVMWTSGVGFAHLAFTHVRDREGEVQDLVREPNWWFGVITGLMLWCGILLAALWLRSGRRGLLVASIVPAVIGAPLFVNWAPHPHGNAPPVGFFSSEPYGRMVAEREHKPVVVVFNATWCCKEVEHDMFPDPRVREEARRFVAIAVDASDDDEPEVRRLQERYKIVGLPAIVILDSDGGESSRITQMTPPEELAAAMRRAR